MSCLLDQEGDHNKGIETGIASKGVLAELAHTLSSKWNEIMKHVYGNQDRISTWGRTGTMACINLDGAVVAIDQSPKPDQWNNA